MPPIFLFLGKRIYSQSLSTDLQNAILLRRQIGTVKSGLRFYYGNPSVVKNKEMLKNRVASWLSGLEIYGDVIMAKVGSTYKSKDPGCRFWHENYTLHDLYKLVKGKYSAHQI